ncbi:hypothetical protein D3C72_2069410 [compost metagenome]
MCLANLQFGGQRIELRPVNCIGTGGGNASRSDVRNRTFGTLRAYTDRGKRRGARKTISRAVDGDISRSDDGSSYRIAAERHVTVLSVGACVCANAHGLIVRARSTG